LLKMLQQQIYAHLSSVSGLTLVLALVMAVIGLHVAYNNDDGGNDVGLDCSPFGFLVRGQWWVLGLSPVIMTPFSWSSVMLWLWSLVIAFRTMRLSLFKFLDFAALTSTAVVQDTQLPQQLLATSPNSPISPADPRNRRIIKWFLMCVVMQTVNGGMRFLIGYGLFRWTGFAVPRFFYHEAYYEKSNGLWPLVLMMIIVGSYYIRLDIDDDGDDIKQEEEHIHRKYS
jgi:hypothetical protein